MITEDYVSFEIAKLLKEKGFYGECMSMYVIPKPHTGMGNPNEAKIAPHGRDSYYYDGYLYQCEAPTLQMAIKWLREVHHCVICITPLIFYCGEIASKWGYCIWADDNTEVDEESSPRLESYEEACEAAIKYCLEKLI